MPWQYQSPQHSAEPHVGSQHPRVVVRVAKGQSRTHRLATSSTQNAAYRRLALTILGLDVATLADELRSAPDSANERITGLTHATTAA